MAKKAAKGTSLSKSLKPEEKRCAELLMMFFNTDENDHKAVACIVKFIKTNYRAKRNV